MKKTEIYTLERQPYVVMETIHHKLFHLLLPEMICVSPEGKKMEYSGWIDMDVKWSRTGRDKSVVVGKWTRPGEILFAVKYVPHRNGVDLKVRIRNLGKRQWKGSGEVMMCFRKTSVPDFVDTKGERTYVIGEDGMIKTKLLDNFPKFKPDTILHCVTGTGTCAAKELRLANSLMATVSARAKEAVGVAVFPCDRVSGNFSERLNCLHSNIAVLPLAPRQEEIAYGRIYFHKGGIGELYARYLKDWRYWQTESYFKENGITSYHTNE